MFQTCMLMLHLKHIFCKFRTEINLSLSQRQLTRYTRDEYFTAKQMLVFCLYIYKYYIFVMQSHNPVRMLYLHKTTNNCLNSENKAHVIDISP